MCMAKLQEFECPEEGIGYKVLSRSYRLPDHYYGIFYQSPETPDGYELNKEYKAAIYDKLTDYGSTPLKYKTGFHIFLDVEDARKYAKNNCSECIMKVKYRNVLAKGFHCRNTMNFEFEMLGITAEYMTILGAV